MRTHYAERRGFGDSNQIAPEKFDIGRACKTQGPFIVEIIFERFRDQHLLGCYIITQRHCDRRCRKSVQRPHHLATKHSVSLSVTGQSQTGYGLCTNGTHNN